MSEITAIYENGVLRPLTPLTLDEGQQVRLQVLPTLFHDEALTQRLKPLIEAGLLTLPPNLEEVPTVSDAQLRELTQNLKSISGHPLSETIIEERGEF